MLSHKWFKEVGTQIREAYRTHVFTEGLDVNDKPFSSTYKNPKYKALKQAGKLPRQRGKASKIYAPIVSTDLLRDFGTIYKVTDTGFQMGWSTYGDRVEKLRKQGRELTTKEDALPKSLVKTLKHETNRCIKKGLGGNKVTRHKIGK